MSLRQKGLTPGRGLRNQARADGALKHRRWTKLQVFTIVQQEMAVRVALHISNDWIGLCRLPDPVPLAEFLLEYTQMVQREAQLS